MAEKIGGSGSISAYGYGIATDSSNNIYVTGKQNVDTAGNDDIGIVKFDSNGTVLWQKKIGGTAYDVSRSFAVDSNDDVIVFSHQGSDTAGENDFGIMKIDPIQTSDMNLTVGDMTLTVANATLTISDMSLGTGVLNFQLGNSNLTIADIDISGNLPDELQYTG